MSSSTALGIIGAGVLYLPAAIVNILIGFKLNKKLKEENNKKQILIDCFLFSVTMENCSIIVIK